MFKYALCLGAFHVIFSKQDFLYTLPGIILCGSRAKGAHAIMGYIEDTLAKQAYSTVYSQAVTHPSTNTAQCCLTSVIGRELVHST